MKKILLFVLFLPFLAAGQTPLRYFLEVPGVFFHSTDVQDITRRAGLKSEIGFCAGTHFVNGRAAVQLVSSFEPEADDIQKSINYAPITRLELGVGPYRTNGQQCSVTNRGAYTAQAVGLFLYNFDAKKTDYGAGVELSRFLIRDMKRNTEMVLRGEYLAKSKVITLDLGFRFFLNLRAFD
jgi:hypothetical protein